MRPRFVSGITLPACLLLACLDGAAQQTKVVAPVVVTVTDATGAVFPDAEVKIVPSLTAAQSQPLKLQTDKAGKLSVHLDPGEYDVTARALGFKDTTRHIFVQSATSQSVGIVLQTASTIDVVVGTNAPVDSSKSSSELPRVEVAPPQALPKYCSQEDTVKYGRPVFFPGGQGLSFGVSSPHDHYKKNEEARIYIWLSNQSTSATQMSTCCEQSFLAQIQVTDIYGRRLESSPEIFERKTLQQGRSPVQVCTCSGPITTYPAGFCGVVDQGTLNRPDTAYDLAPGTYIVEKGIPKLHADPSSPTLLRTDPKEKVTGLAITIEAP